ncbi:MAG: PqqD family protein [Actinomycetota bacterium]
MSALPLATPLRRAPVLWRRSGDQVLIRRRGDDRLTVLAGTGVALWEALAEPTTLDALATGLADAHGAPAATVTADLQVALVTLVDDGVVIAG